MEINLSVRLMQGEAVIREVQRQVYVPVPSQTEVKEEPVVYLPPQQSAPGSFPLLRSRAGDLYIRPFYEQGYNLFSLPRNTLLLDKSFVTI